MPALRRQGQAAGSGAGHNEARLKEPKRRCQTRKETMRISPGAHQIRGLIFSTALPPPRFAVLGPICRAWGYPDQLDPGANGWKPREAARKLSNRRDKTLHRASCQPPGSGSLGRPWRVGGTRGQGRLRMWRFPDTGSGFGGTCRSPFEANGPSSRMLAARESA